MGKKEGFYPVQTLPDGKLNKIYFFVFKISYKKIPVDTDKLRLSEVPIIGSFINSCALLSISLETPDC